VSAAYNKLSVLVKEQKKDLIDFKSQEATKKWEAPPKAGTSDSTTSEAQCGKNEKCNSQIRSARSVAIIIANLL